MVDNISNMAGDIPLQDAFTMLAGRGAAEERRKKEADMGVKQKEAQLYEQAIPQMARPAPEFKPPKETMDNMLSLGSMLALAGTMMGGKGMMGGMGAMQSMGAMLEAYKQNRTEEYQKAKEQYETNLKSWQQQRSIVKDILEMRLKQAAATGALQNETNNAVRDLIAAGATVPAEMVKKMGLSTAAGQIGQTNQNIDAQMQTLGPAAVKFWDDLQARVTGAQEALKFQKMAREAQVTQGQPIKIQLEGKTVYADRAGNPLRDAEGNVIEAAETRGGMAQKQMNQRIINATAGAASAFEAIGSVRGGTTTGILPYLSTKEGMLSYLENAGGRAIADDDAKILDVYYTGLARNIAAIEASGAATGLVGLTKTFESLKPMVGDSNYVVASKLADARRITEETVNALIESGILEPAQSKTAEKLVSRVKKAIPYTVEEVNKAVAGGRTEPSIEQVTSGTVGKVVDVTSEAQAEALPPGTKFRLPDGRTGTVQ